MLYNTDYRYRVRVKVMSTGEIEENSFKGIIDKNHVNMKFAVINSPKTKEEMLELIDETDVLFFVAENPSKADISLFTDIGRIGKELNISAIGIISNSCNFETAQLEENVDILIMLKEGQTPLQVIQGTIGMFSDSQIIGIDFADIRSLLNDKGIAYMGIGTEKGENWAINAAKIAIANIELIENAKSVVMTLIGDENTSLSELGKAIDTVAEIYSNVDDAEICVSCVTDKSLNGEAKVIIIATGFNEADEVIVNNKLHENSDFEIPEFLRRKTK